MSIQFTLEGVQCRCLNHLRWQTVPDLGGSDSKEILPYVQPETVLQEFVTVRPRHPLGRSGEQMFPQILVVTPEKLIDGHQITPEPVLFQAKESHGSQPVIVRSVFLTSDHARGPPLDSLKLLHILFELWSPKLDALLQLQPHQG